MSAPARQRGSGRPVGAALRLAAALLAMTALLPMESAQAGDKRPRDTTSGDEDARLSAARSPATINGQAIYRQFRDGLADKTCAPGASARWKKHFASAPKRLAARGDDALPLFGYVVDALRAAHLPTEYALIPFVESGYRPGARSPAGPAGLWQMIARTARHHRVPIRAGYDGRLSPVDSTRAAVRYLKTLHGMFDGNWQLVVMAYNAGEHRMLGAVRRSGGKAASVDPATLPGVPDITRAYPRKLHALSCLLEQADDRESWRADLDREVPQLGEVTLPAGAQDLREWARGAGHDAQLLARLNPAHAAGPLRAEARRILAPVPRPPGPDAGE
jgi:membrane-bound lytic murein transglycosylase D